MSLHRIGVVLLSAVTLGFWAAPWNGPLARAEDAKNRGTDKTAAADTPAPNASLLHRWQFDPEHVEGNRVKDQAGSVDAKIVGPVAFSRFAPQALLLDGNSSKRHHIAVEQAEKTLQLPAKTLSVEAWVRIDRPHERGGILGAAVGYDRWLTGWRLGFHNFRFSFALASEDNDRAGELFSSSFLDSGFWYHVVGTYDGQTQRIYVDGKLRGEAKIQSGAIRYPAAARYRLAAFGEGEQFHATAGQIEQASVWARALSPGEVRRRYESRAGRFPDIDPLSPKATDWPTYGRDNQHTGIAPGDITFPLTRNWVHRTPHPPEPAWPPSAQQDIWHKQKLRSRVVYDRAFHLVAVGEALYYASSSDDRVCCLDAETGRPRWNFYTEGPVRLAPTVAGNQLLFGSDDGFVYCLNTQDGSLLWKLQLGPSDRRISGNGRVISSWPVRTSVLVEENLAYFCAGLFPQQGVYQAAVDLQTGEKVASQVIDVSAQGYLQRRAGRLFIPTGRNPAGQFAARLARRGKGVATDHRRISNDYPYAFIGCENARIGGGKGQVTAFSTADGHELWSANVDGAAYSLALARGKLFVSTDRGEISCFSSSPTIAETSDDAPPREFPYPNEATQRRYADAAEWVIEKTNIRRGYCLVVGSGNGRLACELAQRTDLKIIGVETDAALVDASRQVLAAAGLYGRVSIHERGTYDRLPYTDYLFDLVVNGSLADGEPFAGNQQEAKRVLRPGGGVAVFSRNEDQLVRREALDRIGEWTHMYADAANTVCSSDQHVGGEMMLQWFGRPGPEPMIDRHHRTVAPLWKDGRLFVPANDRVIAVDAYNGTPLWNVEVPESRRVVAFRDCSYMVAADDLLYVAATDRCYALDAQTGQKRATLRVPELDDGKKRDWGYLASVGEMLIGSGTKQGASRREQSLKVDTSVTYWDFVPVICSEFLFGIERTQNLHRWNYPPPAGSIINTTIAAGDGKLFFIESTNRETLASPQGRALLSELVGQGSNLVALDLETGKTLWKQPHDFSATQHSLYVSYAKGKVAVVGSRNSGTDKEADRVLYDVHVVDAESGELRWKKTQRQTTKIGGDHGEQDQHPVIVGETLFCEPFAYNLHTGAPLPEWKWNNKHRRGCGNVSASASSFFFRENNPTMFDLSSNSYTKITTISRPGCWVNMIPAGGLLLIPEASSGCRCNYPMQSSLAFLPIARPQPGPADR